MPYICVYSNGKDSYKPINMSHHPLITREYK